MITIWQVCQYYLLIIFVCIYTIANIHQGLHVCVFVCVYATLKHSFPVNTELRPHPDKFCTPAGDSYSSSAVFPRVFTMCTVSSGDCLEGSGWTRPQTVLIQLPTLRLDNSPWREGPEKWIRPVALTFFSFHSPDWTDCCPHSWAPSQVTALLVTSY